MSANNWAVCPVCLEAAIVNSTQAVDEYDFQTFREDYELHLNGLNVEVHYSGFCTVCGSGILFRDTRPIEVVR